MRLWLPIFRRFNLIGLEKRLRGRYVKNQAMLVTYI